MRIGIYTSILASEPGYERNVSAHIQIPLHAARLLTEAGHETHLISTRQPSDKTYPECRPEQVELHLVTDGRVRPNRLRGGKARHGIRPLAMWSQLNQIRRLVRHLDLDVLHLFGFARTAQLGGLLKRIGLATPTVATLIGDDVAHIRSSFGRRLVTRNDALVTATEAVAKVARPLGPPVHVVRHGFVRSLAPDPDAVETQRSTVLFWRDGTEANGADLCRDAFAHLAPEYPDRDFVFAVRPTYRDVEGLDELAARHSNVHLHRFPYAEGVSIESLLARASVVVLPFRKLSIQPQFAILESLSAGAALLTTDVGSNPEIIEHNVNGMLVPPDDGAAVEATLRELLARPADLASMGECAAKRIRAEWNWDNYVEDMLTVYQGVCTKPEATAS